LVLQRLSAGSTPMAPEVYRTAFTPMLAGVLLAMALTTLLRETGSAARAPGRPAR
jgi:hypothetical protein